MVSSFGTSFLFTPSTREDPEYSFCIEYELIVNTLKNVAKNTLLLQLVNIILCLSITFRKLISAYLIRPKAVLILTPV